MDSNQSAYVTALIPRLREVKLAGWRQIQAEAGVPVGTIRRLVYQDPKKPLNPRVQTIERLERWFAERDKKAAA